MNLSELIKAGFEDLKNFLRAGTDARVSELTKSFDGATAKITQLEADLATAKQTIGTLTKERDDAQAANATKDKEISTLKASQADFDKSVAEKSAQLLASNGIPANKLPAGEAAGSSAEAQIDALQKQLSEEKDPEKKYAISSQLTALKFGTPAKK